MNIFINRFFSLPTLKNMSFFLVILVCFMYLTLSYPVLRPFLSIYAILFFMAEVYKRGNQMPQHPFLKGLIYFIIAGVISAIVFSLVPIQRFSLDAYPFLDSLPYIVIMMYFFIVAYYEEAIFRGVLPASMKNYLLPAVLYAGFHYYVLSMTVQIYSLPSTYIYGGIAFSFLFAFFMQYVAHKTNGIVVPTAIHWTFNLSKLGLLSFVSGGII